MFMRIFAHRLWGQHSSDKDLQNKKEETDKMDWPIFIKENALSINISLPKKKKYQAWWFQWLSSIKYLRKKYH